MKITNLLVVRTGRREIVSVLLIWAVLLAAALAALFLFHRSSVRLINHIEYVKAGRFIRMLALYEEAKKHADAALTKAGDAPGARISAEDASYRKAVELYNRAFELDPRGTLTADHTLYYQILMRLHEAAGREAETLQAMVRDALTRRDFAAAGDYVARLRELAPSDAETWCLAVEVPLRAGRLEEATSATVRLEDVGGRSAALHELRGRIARAKGKPAVAAQEYTEAVKLLPQKIDLRKELAALLTNAGRREEALRVLEEGRPLGGELDGNYMHLLGMALLGAGRTQEAVEALETAATLEMHSADVHLALARAHHRAGNLARSDRALQRAYALNPELRKKAFEP